MSLISKYVSDIIKKFVIVMKIRTRMEEMEYNMYCSLRDLSLDFVGIQ